MAALKDNINEMIRNLKDTTLKNAEQDWLKTNLAKFSRMLQGQKDLLTVGRLILSELAPVVSAQQGVFYIMDTTPSRTSRRSSCSPATPTRNARTSTTASSSAKASSASARWRRKRSCSPTCPSDYIKITSGLGEAKPLNIIVLPDRVRRRR